MAPKGLVRKADGDSGQHEGQRMLILDPEKCKPQMPAYDFLSRLAGKCGRECIQVTKEGGCKILEEACLACLNRAKHCPDEAVKIINLPHNLTTNCTHRYGANAFKLHGLPTPRLGSVLGLLGCNGIGKSTALRVLAGKLKPNLGRTKDPPDWMEVHTYYRGSDLQNYFTRLLEDDLKVVIKPQLDTDFVKLLAGKKVSDVLKQLDERNVMDSMCERLDLVHLLERDVKQLSGGELQRLAVACCCVRKADNYMFDEPSSFLDVRQRMTVTEVIRDLAVDKEAEAAGEKNASKSLLSSSSMTSRYLTTCRTTCAACTGRRVRTVSSPRSPPAVMASTTTSRATFLLRT
jgi:ATP-binding cassette subfamily E protein 1